VVDIDEAFGFGLKLETDENFFAQAAPVTANATYVTVASGSYTAPADDYLIIVGYRVDTSSDHRYSCKMVVNSTDYGITATSRANPGYGYYTTFKRVTHAGGTLTVSTQVKADGGGTVDVGGGVVIVLRADRFQAFDYGESLGETALTTSNAPVTKLTKLSALQSNWRSLVLFGMQGYLDTDATGAAVAMEAFMNGTAIGLGAEHGVRIQTGEPAHYSSVSYMGGRIVTPSLTNDSFTLNYYSQDNAAGVKVKDAVIAVMALVPLT
jgi:hypothetical protein